MGGAPCASSCVVEGAVVEFVAPLGARPVRAVAATPACPAPRRAPWDPPPPARPRGGPRCPPAAGARNSAAPRRRRGRPGRAAQRAHHAAHREQHLAPLREPQLGVALAQAAVEQALLEVAREALGEQPGPPSPSASPTGRGAARRPAPRARAARGWRTAPAARGRTHAGAPPSPWCPSGVDRVDVQRVVAARVERAARSPPARSPTGRAAWRGPVAATVGAGAACAGARTHTAGRRPAAWPAAPGRRRGDPRRAGAASRRWSCRAPPAAPPLRSASRRPSARDRPRPPAAPAARSGGVSSDSRSLIQAEQPVAAEGDVALGAAQQVVGEEVRAGRRRPAAPRPARCESRR